MRRKSIESELIINLDEKLAELEFRKVLINANSNNHIFSYSLQKPRLKYVLTFRITNSNQYQCDSHLNIYSEDFNKVLKEIDDNLLIIRYDDGNEIRETENFSIMKIDLDKYIHEENARAVCEGFVWNRVFSKRVKFTKEDYVRDGASIIVQKIFDWYVSTAIELIKRIDSLLAIHNIYNSFFLDGGIENAKEEPEVLSICFPYSQQLTYGAVLAYIFEKEKFSEIYLKYQKWYKDLNYDRFGYKKLFDKIPPDNYGIPK